MFARRHDEPSLSSGHARSRLNDQDKRQRSPDEAQAPCSQMSVQFSPQRTDKVAMSLSPVLPHLFKHQPEEVSSIGAPLSRHLQLESIRIPQDIETPHPEQRAARIEGAVFRTGTKGVPGRPRDCTAVSIRQGQEKTSSRRAPPVSRCSHCSTNHCFFCFFSATARIRRRCRWQNVCFT